MHAWIVETAGNTSQMLPLCGTLQRWFRCGRNKRGDVVLAAGLGGVFDVWVLSGMCLQLLRMEDFMATPSIGGASTLQAPALPKQGCR